MESWYGDLQNSGSAEGSLIKSGLFLREFRTVPWAHLDIGGTGYFRKTTPYARARRDRRDPRDARRARARRREGLAPTARRAAGAGASRADRLTTSSRSSSRSPARAFGVVADRLAVRWPEHDEEHPAGRPIGWRTVALGGDRGVRVLAARRSVRGRRAARPGPVRAVVRDARRRVRDRSRPAPPARRADAAGHPDRAAARRVGPEPARRRRTLVPAIRDRGRRPGRAVPRLDPVRGGGVRAGRREAARRGRADDRASLRAFTGLLAGLFAAGDRAGGAARDAADRAADVRAVRAVPDLRRAVGDLRPSVVRRLARPARRRGCSIDVVEVLSGTVDSDRSATRSRSGVRRGPGWDHRRDGWSGRPVWSRVWPSGWSTRPRYRCPRPSRSSS